MCCSFFVKIYFNFREIIFFRSTAQICKFSSWISYPSCVTSCDEYTWPPVFLQHNPLFYLLNLIPCHYWSWQRNIYFLVNIFVRHTFSMSKSSIKTKTVLTMTDMTQSTELQAFKRPKDGYKVTVKISLCICVVLSWDELKVQQNLLTGLQNMKSRSEIEFLGDLPKYSKFVRWMLTSSLKIKNIISL